MHQQDTDDAYKRLFSLENRKMFTQAKRESDAACACESACASHAFPQDAARRLCEGVAQCRLPRLYAEEYCSSRCGFLWW